MKNKSLKLVISFFLVVISSCDEPETVVTDIVHTDGSVTRKIEMKNMENKFKISHIQVPFDSTWIVRDTLEISEKGDTTWVKRAEKFFKSTDELNRVYVADSGSNREVLRRTEFKKRFRWFNTEFRFAEIVDKELFYGYPVSDFLNKEELLYFYSPDDVNSNLEHGPDSLKIKALKDTIDRKTERWLYKSLVSGWIGEFSKLISGKTGDEVSFNSLKAREDELVRIAESHSGKFDSLWKNGTVMREFIGESNSTKYKTEADSALNLVTKALWVDFRTYTQRISMPGTIIGTNGFLDSLKVVQWPVKSDYFLTQPYEMWAESKVPNIWAWILSGVLLLFVLTGVIFRYMKKG